MIGKIERVGLREVWKHEAHDLTTWLTDNIDVLSDAINLPLSNPEAEQAIGSFNVDIVAEDANGNAVVIENQLERSDHDHLGKLLTYLVGIEAKAGIWVVAEPRPEHISTITWLNESAQADFFLVKIEAIRIGDSPPAPLLTLIVGPSEEAREVGRTKQEIAERYLIRERFWSLLLEKAKERTKLHANISPSRGSYCSTSAGVKGLEFVYAVLKNEMRVLLWIDGGKGWNDENRRRFDVLYAQRDEIEGAYGGSLEWNQVEGRRSLRVQDTFDAGGYQDEEDWDEIQAKAIDAMIRFEKALRPHMKGLKRSRRG
jgi:hypothetical protein